MKEFFEEEKKEKKRKKKKNKKKKKEEEVLVVNITCAKLDLVCLFRRIERRQSIFWTSVVADNIHWLK